MIVDLGYGKVEGVLEYGVTVFRSIPYAASPVGERRFLSPAPHPGWTGVRSAAEYGPVARQPNADPLLSQSEDCLTLNIWTKEAGEFRKPVLFHVHGGGFTGGSGRGNEGIRWADDDVVYVSVNYRLGAFGFLQLGDWLGEPYRTAGNNGLLDVIAALTWVRDHIASFGGDPGRVTLIGGSAGAKLISSLLAVPAANGLFHGMIAHSGAVQSVRDAGTAAEVTRRLLQGLRIGESEAEKLLTLPAEDILAVQKTFIGIHHFGPVIDGVTIPDAPLQAIGSGHGISVPLLIGTNKDEAKSYTLHNPVLQSPNLQGLEHFFGNNAFAVWNAYQSAAASKPSADAWNEVLTDHLYRIGAYRLAEVLSERGTNVWLYRFDWENEWGALHAIEWPFVCNLEHEELIPAGWEAAATGDGKRLADRMHAAWAAFVHHGNPRTERGLLPDWPTFSIADGNAMVLNTSCCVKRLLPPDSEFPNQAFVLA